MQATPLVVGPLNYPNGDVAFNMTIARCTTATPTVFPNPASNIKVQVEGSLDAITWLDICGLTTTGGIIIDSDTKQEATETGLFVSIPVNSPLTGQNNRKVRVTFTTLSGPPPTLSVSVATA